MNNLFKKILLPFVAIGLLTGCDWSDDKVLEEASNFGAIVVNGKSGAVYSDRSITINLSTGDSIYVSKSIIVRDVIIDEEPQNVTVTATYDLDEATKSQWLFRENKPDELHNQYIPIVPLDAADNFSTTLTATLVYEEKTLELEWHFNVNAKG